MASVTYGKSIMSSVIMAKILWQMKLSLLQLSTVYSVHALSAILPITPFLRKLEASACDFKSTICKATK
jgi:hypothetical protein